VPAQRVARFRHFARDAVRGLGADSNRLAGQLLRGAVEIFGHKRPDRALRHTADFLVTEGLDARLSWTQFNKLEDQLRMALLSAPELQTQLLTPAAREQARALRAKARALSPAGCIPALDEALEQIAAGDIADEGVLPALALWIPQARDLMPLEVVVRRFPDTLPENDNPRLVRWLSRQPPQPVLLALSLLARPASRWAEAMRAWEDADLRSVVALLGPDRVAVELLNADAPLPLWRRIARFPGCASAVLADTGRRIYELMSPVTPDHEFERRLTRFLRLMALCEPLGEHRRQGNSLGLPFLHIVQDATPRTLRRFLSLPALRKLRQRNPAIHDLALAALAAWRSRLQRTGQTARTAAEQIGFDLYLQFLEDNLDLLIDVPEADLFPDELDLVFTSPRREVRQFAQSLLAGESEDRRRALEGYLEHRAAAGIGLPESLWQSLRGAPARLDAVLLRHPALLDAPGAALLPIGHLLKLAFRSRDLARRLEAAVPRATLLTQLPDVQARPRRSARVRAARELALVIGLDLYPFLLKLAWQLPREGEGHAGHAFDGLYRAYELPKKSGGKRTITVPQDGLKALQRRILDNALEHLPVSPHATGFRKGLSIVANAHAHTGAAVVVNVDIRQCFPNTAFPLIHGVAAQVAQGRLSPLAAWFLAELMSFSGALPTGAPTSPAVLNVALAAADRAIGTACDRRGVTYTRYADDLTFSGEGGVTAVLPFVIDVLRGCGFELDEKKTNIFRKGRRQVVTGLVVNEKPNVVRALRRRLRAAVHHRIAGRTPYWHGKPMGDSELLGRIGFLAQTQPAEAATLRAALGPVLAHG